MQAKGQATGAAVMNDSGMGIVGVIVGAILVLGVVYLAFGERMGLRTAAPGTTIKVEAPTPTTPTVPK
jgi:hypothetical protein